MEKTEQKMPWKEFFSLVKSVIPSKILLIVAILLSALSSGAGLLIPLATQNMVDDLANNFLNKEIILLMGGLFFANAIFSGISIYLLTFLGQRTTENLRFKLWKKMIFLPVSFFDEKRSGKLVSQITNDTTQIKNVITSHIITMISGGFSIVGSLVALFLLDAKLTSLILLCGVIMLILVRPFGDKMYKISKENQEKNAQLTSAVSQTLSEIRLVKSSNAEYKEIDHIRNIIEDIAKLGIKSGKVQAIMSPCLSLVGLLIVVFIVGYGGVRVSSGALTTGNLVAFILYVFQIITPMGELFSTITQIHIIKGASERIMSTLNEREENISEGEEFKNEKIDMYFENVSFSYDGCTQHLKNVSFDVPQNSFTAIVGPSGAGKTTIFSLIERYYKPKLGKILVNGKLLEDYSVEEWRKEIGYASQDVPIIDATIRDNITYGLDDTIDDERLYQVAEEACLSDFIEKLPDKYDTYVGERGIKLSGGQKQRIGIARAILRNPKLLLLDEATSNLDSILEKRIQEAFGRVMEGRTTIVIAHRLATIKQADQIIFLDSGRVTGIGTHNQLFKEHDLYRQYIQFQFPDNPVEA